MHAVALSVQHEIVMLLHNVLRCVSHVLCKVIIM